MSPDQRDTTRFEYDDLCRRTAAIDVRGRRTRFDYTEFGLLEAIWEPHPDTTLAPGAAYEPLPTLYTYSPDWWNLATVTDGTIKTTYVYHPNGSDVDAVRDALGGETRYEYDAIKRPRFVRRIAGVASGYAAGLRSPPPPSVVEYRYDDVGRLRTMIDPIGVVSTWLSDAGGRLIRRCVASVCDRTEYNDHVNPTTLITRNGDYIQQRFDAAGAMIGKVINQGTSTKIDSIDFGYDTDGNLTAVNNQYSRISRSYDRYGRLGYEGQGIRKGTSGFFHTVEVWHAFDRNGRRKRTYIDGTSKMVRQCTPAPIDADTMPSCMQPWVRSATDSVTYHYDRSGNLDRITNTLWGYGGNAWGYAYDAKGRLARHTVPSTSAGSNDVQWSYDDNDQISHYDLASRPDEQPIRDGLGRVIQLNTWHTTQYTFDGLGQLTHSSSTAGSPSSDEFWYDKAGNRDRDQRWDLTYDGAGKLVSKQSGGCQLRYRYNLNGDQTEQYWNGAPCGDTKRVSSYDPAGRMTRMETYPAVCGTNQEPCYQPRTFWYDGLGRRILMEADSASSATSSGERGLWRYWWVDDNVLVKTFNIPNDTAVDWTWPEIRRVAGDTLRTVGEWFFYAPGARSGLMLPSRLSAPGA